ncbi:MAG: hypothetical protein M3O32_08415 [Actinomycetota bacterium]|nr:hypothetical protein [Actinomycetota bacterium]
MAAHACDGRFDRIGVTAVDDDPVALGRQEFRDGESDAAGTSDDDRARGQLASPNCMASMFQ